MEDLSFDMKVEKKHIMHVHAKTPTVMQTPIVTVL